MNRLICAEFPKEGGGTFIIEGELIRREDGMEFLDLTSTKYITYIDGYKFIMSTPTIYIVRSEEKFQVMLVEELAPSKFWVTRTK